MFWLKKKGKSWTRFWLYSIYIYIFVVFFFFSSFFFWGGMSIFCCATSLGPKSSFFVFFVIVFFWEGELFSCLAFRRRKALFSPNKVYFCLFFRVSLCGSFVFLLTPPFHSLSLYIYISLLLFSRPSLFVCFLSFVCPSLFLSFFSLPCFFAFHSWKEQGQ